MKVAIIWCRKYGELHCLAGHLCKKKTSPVSASDITSSVQPQCPKKLEALKNFPSLLPLCHARTTMVECCWFLTAFETWLIKLLREMKLKTRQILVSFVNQLREQIGAWCRWTKGNFPWLWWIQPQKAVDELKCDTDKLRLWNIWNTVNLYW